METDNANRTDETVTIMPRTRKPLDPTQEIIRKNMAMFRKQTKMSQADVSNLSGVRLANLQRYEKGKTTTIPFHVIEALAHVYGRGLEDFSNPVPPAPPRLEDMPIFTLQARPGSKYDQETFHMMKRWMAQTEKDMLARRDKKRK